MTFLRWPASMTPVLTTTASTRGGPDVGLHVALDLGSQRASGHGEGDLDLDQAPLPDADGGDHAQLDDVRTQLGIDHPASAAARPLRSDRAFHGPGA